jgi:hypothetical protein
MASKCFNPTWVPSAALTVDRLSPIEEPPWKHVEDQGVHVIGHKRQKHAIAQEGSVLLILAVHMEAPTFFSGDKRVAVSKALETAYFSTQPADDKELLRVRI